MPSPSARSDTAAKTTADRAGPRFGSLWASLVYALATLTLAYPALGGAFLLNPRSDQYKAGYAIREFAAEHLRSGRGFPQWNPFIMGGLPYVAAMHGDIFYPTFLLRMIMPTDMAMTWEFPIHLFLCGLFTFWFLRSWNIGFWGSLVGGLAYLLGGSIAGYAGPGHDGKLFVSAMLPLALQLSNEGRYAEAEALFNDAARLAPRSEDPTAQARLAHYRGLHALNQGQLQAALTLLTQADARNQQIKFCEMDPDVRIGADIIGLTKYVELHDTESSALKAFA